MPKQTQPSSTELREALYHAELECEGYAHALISLAQLGAHMGDRRGTPYRSWRTTMATLQERAKLAQRDRRNVVRKLRIDDSPQAVQEAVFEVVYPEA